MELKVLNGASHNAPAALQVADEVFAKNFNEDLVHQVVQAYRARGRAGTKAQKTRAQVRGGGAKPRPQKGSGRARAGTIRSPIWRGGGVAFAAAPRDYEQKVNKKMYIGALCAILSELVRQERLVVVEEFSVNSPKTKELVGKLATLGLSNVLIVVEELDANLYLAKRNLKHVDIYDATMVDPLSLIGFEKVLFTVAALKKLEERLV